MEADPRFPDRPDHPDFDSLSDCALGMDAAAERNEVDDIVRRIVDPESLTYLVLHRAGNALVAAAAHQVVDGEEVDVHSLLAAAILDGFVIGATYERRRDVRDRRAQARADHADPKQWWSHE